jgi:16S rRNA (uracil1498-N3)-methyltransferase
MYYGAAFFYKENIVNTKDPILLEEATSKHVVQVLRMQKGEQLRLTNGKGDLFTVELQMTTEKGLWLILLNHNTSMPQRKKLALPFRL